MDIPTYFYHATSEINEALIRQQNSLMPQVHNPPEDWMLLVKEQRELVEKGESTDGVWFCATLYKGDLPTISPYGDRRVRVTIADVIDQLGGNVELYKGVTNQKVGDNFYTRLMLVKEGNNFEVLKYMTPLNIANNEWLTLYGGYRVARRPIWVEIYIPYPIDLSYGVWDQL